MSIGHVNKDAPETSKKKKKKISLSKAELLLFPQNAFTSKFPTSGNSVTFTLLRN